MSDEVRVYVRHIRAARYCLSGGREWFANHDLSWSDFLENGMPAEILEASGDEMAFVVCRLAREEAAQKGQE